MNPEEIRDKIDMLEAIQLVQQAVLGELVLQAGPALRERLRSVFQLQQDAALNSLSSDRKLQLLRELAGLYLPPSELPGGSSPSP